MNIEKSKFYSLRPKNVLPSSGTPHNVCHYLYAVELSDYCLHKQIHCFLLESTSQLKRLTNITKCQHDVPNLMKPEQILGQESIFFKKWEKSDAVFKVIAKQLTLELVKELNSIKN